MKKTDFLSGWCIRTSIFLLLVIQQAAMAQVPEPLEWNSFVNGLANQQVSDTFRMQTFNNLSTDNWLYTTIGNTELFDASSIGFHVKDKDLSLKLPAGTSIHLSDVSSDKYSNVKAYGIYAAYQLCQGEKLLISAKRQNKPITNHEWLSPNDNYTADFTESKADNLSQKSYLAVDNPIDLTFSVGTGSIPSQEGFYAFDSIYMTGSIAKYSYFSGIGDWENISLWSHLPALRHRSALIHGNVSVNSDIYCKDIYIGDGSITVNNNKNLTAKNICLYFSYISLINKLYAYKFLIKDLDNAYKTLRSVPNSYNFLINHGKIDLSGSLTVELTYPEKGQWYFLSLPFDVYAEGIDPAFQFRDETEKGSGNYFYLQQYNGDRRATRQTATGNWEVVSTATLSTHRPLLEKNKGYLIAIDKTATSQSLRFSSRAGDIPSDFGRNGSISVQASIANADPNDTHSGWYLCGNPLPCSLPFSAIASSLYLDGHIYIYDGNEYKAHPLNNTEAIPPFSAFFVKAQKSTEIQISIDASLSTYQTSIVTSAPFISQQVEPSTRLESTTTISSIQARPQSYIVKNELHLVDMSINGKIVIMNSIGKICSVQSFATGNSIIYLPNQAGLYIVRIESTQYKKYHKYLYAS